MWYGLSVTHFVISLGKPNKVQSILKKKILQVKIEDEIVEFGEEN